MDRLIAIPIALLALAILLMYMAHSLTEYSYSFINARTCMTIIKAVMNYPLNRSGVEEVVDHMPITYQVSVTFLNSSKKYVYGNYIPIAPSSMGVAISTGIGVTVLGPSTCMYTTDGYIVTVRLGIWPWALASWIGGVAALVGVGVSLYMVGRRIEGE